MKKVYQSSAIKVLVASVMLLSTVNVYADEPKVAESDKPVVGQIVNTLTTLSGGPHKGDALNDATAVWPETRKQVELGTLTIKTVDADGLKFEKANMFNPLALVDGIEPSDDPILLARPGAYAVSFGRRLGQ